MKITDLNEATKPTKVKTAGPDLSAFADDLLGPDMNAPAKVKRQDFKKLSGKRKIAGIVDTQNKVKDIQMPDGAAEKFGSINDMDIEDELSDEEAAHRAGFNIDAGYHEPKTPSQSLVTVTSIPAVVAREISNATHIEPDWHQVKHLPGYLKNPIRALGRKVFSVFTSTAIEDVQVLANLNGQGPNSKEELNAVAGYLMRNGQDDPNAVMDFEKSIPGYKADMKIIRDQGVTHLVVQDFAGHYIYSWPSADDVAVKGAQRKVGLDKKQLS